MSVGGNWFDPLIIGLVILLAAVALFCFFRKSRPNTTTNIDEIRNQVAQRARIPTRTPAGTPSSSGATTIRSPRTPRLSV